MQSRGRSTKKSAKQKEACDRREVPEPESLIGHYRAEIAWSDGPANTRVVTPGREALLPNSVFAELAGRHKA